MSDDTTNIGKARDFLDNNARLYLDMVDLEIDVSIYENSDGLLAISIPIHEAIKRAHTERSWAWIEAGSGCRY